MSVSLAKAKIAVHFWVIGGDRSLAKLVAHMVLIMTGLFVSSAEAKQCSMATYSDSTALVRTGLSVSFAKAKVAVHFFALRCSLSTGQDWLVRVLRKG